jgi:hypothetical protein
LPAGTVPRLTRGRIRIGADRLKRLSTSAARSEVENSSPNFSASTLLVMTHRVVGGECVEGLREQLAKLSFLDALDQAFVDLGQGLLRPLPRAGPERKALYWNHLQQPHAILRAGLESYALEPLGIPVHLPPAPARNFFPHNVRAEIREAETPALFLSCA